jgi:TonB C terminal
MKAPSRKELRFAGISVTVLLHGGLVALAVAQSGNGCGGGSADAASSFGDSVTIEASLAFKEVKPRSKQPQKQRRKLYAPPETQHLATDPTQMPAPPDKDQHKVKPNKDEIDINSVLHKNHMDDDDLSTHGVDQVPVKGSESGSEWGTEEDAKGDPYVGELKGRIYKVWRVPSLETGSGKALGCVKLDQSGKIVDHLIKKKSGNANLDRSVELALRQATDMDKPVPGKLVPLLTVKGICFEFEL